LRGLLLQIGQFFGPLLLLQQKVVGERTYQREILSTCRISLPINLGTTDDTVASGEPTNKKARYTPYARDICGGGAVRGTQIGYLWVWGREHTLDEVGAPDGAAAEVVDGLAYRLEGR